MTSPFVHFVGAQNAVWPAPLAELRGGRKATHWMWFVFPQFARDRMTLMSERFAIRSRAEAEAYLAHRVVGCRLRQATEAALASSEADAVALFGSIDAMKFQSSMTLFDAVSDDEALFATALARFYEGTRDERTLAKLR